MIEITGHNGVTIAVNPAHISMARGFENHDGSKMTEILFLSGDWRTLQASYDDVMTAIRSGSR